MCLTLAETSERGSSLDQTVSPKSDHLHLMRGSRLREFPTIVIGLTSFWYFGKVVPDGRWSLIRGSTDVLGADPAGV